MFAKAVPGYVVRGGANFRKGVWGLPWGPGSKYRIIPWWGPKGQSPLKLMNFRDFVGLNEVFNLDFCDISFLEYT